MMKSVFHSDYYCLNELIFSPTEASIINHQQRMRLRGKESELLHILIQQYPNIVTREQLAELLWKGTYVTDSTINQTIKALRDSVDDHDRSLIRTLPKRGYVLGVAPNFKCHNSVASKISELQTPLVLKSLWLTQTKLVLLISFMMISSGYFGYVITEPDVTPPILVDGNTVYLFPPDQTELARFSLQPQTTFIERSEQGYRVCQQLTLGVACQNQR